jgi:MFS family permease
MDNFRQVLRSPGTGVVLLLGFLARIPSSCMGILLTLHCVITLGHSYLDAGMIVTFSTLGQTISSPWRGRIVDTKGLRRAVLPTIIIPPLCFVAAVWSPFHVLLALALCAGLFNVPVWSIIRTSLSITVPAGLRRSAFALDSVITEVVFMIGPSAATMAAVTIGTRPMLVAVAVLTGVAGLGIFIVNPPTRSEQLVLPAKLPRVLDVSEGGLVASQDAYGERRLAEDTATGQIPAIEVPQPVSTAATKVSARREMIRLGSLAILIGTLLGSATLTATDLSLVGILTDMGSLPSLTYIMVLGCVGSLTGGLVYGSMKREIGPMWAVMGLGALSVPIAFAPSTAVLAVIMVFAGFCCAPMISSTGEAISRRVPENVRGEAMGWHGSAMTIGAAAGSPVAGALIDALGPGWGVGAAGSLAAVFAGLALIAQQIVRRRRRRRFAEALA